MVLQDRISSEREQHRHGVGNAAGLDYDLPERDDTAALLELEQLAHRAHQIFAARAADAAALQHDGLLLDHSYQVVVHSDRAAFVDDDCDSGVRPFS